MEKSYTFARSSVAEIPEMVEAVIFEEPIAKAYVAKNDDLVILDTEIKSSYSDAYAIALPKGSTALKEKVDSVITKLVESGQMLSLIHI